MLISSQHSWGQEQIEETPNNCKGTGKRRETPWSCSKSGNLRAGLANTHLSFPDSLSFQKIYCCGWSFYFSFGRNKRGTGQEFSVTPALLGMELLLPKFRNSLGGPSSFGMDQSCPGPAAQPSLGAHGTFFQINPSLRLPLVSILGNKQETKVNSRSAGNPPTGNNSQRKMCSLTQQEKVTLPRARKESQVGHSFLLGFPSSQSFLYSELLKSSTTTESRDNLKFPKPEPIKFHFCLDFSTAIKLKFVMDLTPNSLPGSETLSPGKSSHKTTRVSKSGITEKGIYSVSCEWELLSSSKYQKLSIH